jgi:hypothetical protein
MLTRIQVARRLNRSLATVRRLQEARVLDSQRDRKGVHWFREDDVQVLQEDGIPKWEAQSDWFRRYRPAQRNRQTDVTPIHWRGRSRKTTNVGRAAAHQRAQRTPRTSALALHWAAPERHRPRNVQSRVEIDETTALLERIRQLKRDVAQLPRRQLRAVQRAGVTAELAELLATPR